MKKLPGVMDLVSARLRTAGATEREQYETLLTVFTATPYVWGGSSPGGCDCSGSVCCTLNAVYGTDIRVTADMLFRTYFVRGTDIGDGLNALFFLTAPGKAVHVAGCIGGGYYMNVSSREPARCGMVRSYRELELMYRGLRLAERSLDTEAWR